MSTFLLLHTKTEDEEIFLLRHLDCFYRFHFYDFIFGVFVAVILCAKVFILHIQMFFLVFLPKILMCWRYFSVHGRCAMILYVNERIAHFANVEIVGHNLAAIK